MKLKLEKPWDEVKETLKEARTDLTDADLDYDGENASELVSRLAKKMKRSEEHIRAWIESASHTSGLAS